MYGSKKAWRDILALTSHTSTDEILLRGVTVPSLPLSLKHPAEKFSLCHLGQQSYRPSDLLGWARYIATCWQISTQPDGVQEVQGGFLEGRCLF